MGSCCIPTATTPKGTACCICLPYKNDCYLMSAQGLVIVAFLISWIWWIPFVVSCPLMIMLQVVWCCRMDKAGIVAAIILATSSSFFMAYAGIWILAKWKDRRYCSVFTVTNDDDDDDNYYRNVEKDYCREGVWAMVAFGDAILFLGTACCLVIFLFYRMDKLLLLAAAKANHDNDDVQVVEMANVIVPATATAAAAATTDVPMIMAAGTPTNPFAAAASAPPHHFDKNAEV